MSVHLPLEDHVSNINNNSFSYSVSQMQNTCSVNLRITTVENACITVLSALDNKHQQKTVTIWQRNLPSVPGWIILVVEYVFCIVDGIAEE